MHVCVAIKKKSTKAKIIKTRNKPSINVQKAICAYRLSDCVFVYVVFRAILFFSWATTIHCELLTYTISHLSIVCIKFIVFCVYLLDYKCVGVTWRRTKEIGNWWKKNVSVKIHNCLSTLIRPINSFNDKTLYLVQINNIHNFPKLFSNT